MNYEPEKLTKANKINGSAWQLKARLPVALGWLVMQWCQLRESSLFLPRTPAHEMIRLLLNAIFPMITWSHHGMTVVVRVTCSKFCLSFAVLETKHIKENPRVLYLSNVAVKQVTGVRGLAPPFLIPSSQIQRPRWNFPSQCFIKKKKNHAKT